MKTQGDDHTRSESEKDRRIAELEAAVQARDQFLAAAAHELRGPMTAVAMRADALLRTARANAGVPDKLVSDIERLKGYLEQYVKRATTLLDVSRLTSGRLRLEPVTIDLSALVREVVRNTEIVARFHGSRLDMAVQEGVVGVWDRLALEQIIENLLSNALKYGAGKPIEIALSADRDTARFSVRDQGIGISPENQARIFEPFERAVTHSQHGGFGIGLWIVGRLITTMEGMITVTSRRGEGSTFTVTLPLNPKQEASSET